MDLGTGGGYYLACGRPAGVMVHVTVGTGNAVCALMNANRDNVPLLLMICGALSSVITALFTADPAFRAFVSYETPTEAPAGDADDAAPPTAVPT